MPDRLLSYRRVLIVAVHLVLIPAAYFGAFGARFDFHIPPAELRTFVGTLPYLLVIRMLIFAWYGLFRGYWRHVGLRDLVDLGVATTLSTALFAAALLATGLPPALPRSVFLLDWLPRKIMLWPAEVLGIAAKVGSIEPGKLANLLVTRGDPLDIRSEVKYVFIEGKLVGLKSRNTDLCDKFTQ